MIRDYRTPPSGRRGQTNQGARQVGSTILAVDDSATMRKILEITFAGTDFQLVTAATGDDAVAKLRGGGVSLVICDNSLEPTDGYEVAGQLKATAPNVPVLFLSSRQNPFDAGRGGRVDDHMDKPFDTQQLLDRVSKLLGGASVGTAPAAAPAPAPAPAAAPAPAKSRTYAYGGAPQAAAAPSPTKTAGFGAGGLGGPKPSPAPSPAAARAITAPVAQPQAVPAAARPAAVAVSAATAAASSQLASKVGEMGLSPAQADAVLALSREVIERIVWEVVPVLAETLIKEEIARLTK